MKTSIYLFGVLSAFTSQSAVASPVIFQTGEYNFHVSSNTLSSDIEKTEQYTLNPYPHKPRLTFKRDGTFKLTVFSDLHFGENPECVWGPEQDKNSTILMKTVLASEKPDYVCVLSIACHR